MAPKKNSLRIPFLLLPYNIQATIARKLSADTFHRLAIASKFIKEFKNWVLPCDLELFVGNPYFIYKLSRDFPKIHQFQNFQPLCSIKFRSILVDPFEASLKDFVECVRSSGRIFTDKLTIFGQEDDDGSLYVELIRLLKPISLQYSTTFIPRCMMNFIPTYRFDALFFEEQPEIGEIFKFLNFNFLSSDATNIPPMDIVEVIEETLAEKRSQETEMYLNGLDDHSKRIIFDHFKDRRSLLYAPEYHELSIWADETRTYVTNYILFSKFSHNSLWLLSEYYDLFKFKKIHFEDFRKNPGYL